MITRLLTGLTFLFVLRAVEANTEKVIFLAPSRSSLPASLVNINSNSGANALSPEQLIIRSSVPVAFPTVQNPRGLEYWYLLRHLNPEQRYEVRVCWAASQPTEFWLNVFGIDQVPTSLLSALGSAQLDSDHSGKTKSDQPTESVLALRIQAAADFFSSNQTLMQHPPPVDVDIILDPYLLNVFPASLSPTALYISVLAVVGYFVSGVLWRYLSPSAEVYKLRKD